MKVTYSRGVSIIDAVIGSALMLMVFMTIAGVLQLSLDVVTNSRIRAGAIALGNDRMEYLRSLSYTQIGVEGGIPAGIVPQIETVSWNNVDYTRRTSVQYSDDPSDGLGGADTNGITADFKTIRVEVSWESRQGTRSITIVGRVSPYGVETSVPGGTLTIYVVNASAVPLYDAQVDIINTDTNPAIDVRTFTSSDGYVSFIGAPASSNYQITVSRAGYSTAQTYSVSAQNPDPNPRHLTVADNVTTSATFAIDVVGQKTVETYFKSLPEDWSDALDSTDNVSATSSVDITGGSAQLAGVAPYTSPGSIRSTTIQPADLVSWDSFTWTESKPSGTDIRYRVYDALNNLIPDGDLPGNTIGFTTSPVDLGSLSVNEYSGIRLDAELETTDPNETPLLNSWAVSYNYGPVTAPSFSFSMRGTKAIGNNPVIYKYEEDLQTNGGGTLTVQNVEWDTYALSIATTTGYNLAESCNPQPEALAPGASQTTRLYALPYTAHTLLVDVRGAGDVLLEDASVRLYRTGYDETTLSSSCGQSFFESLTENIYTLEVSATGYEDYTNSALNVSGVTTISVVLDPL